VAIRAYRGIPHPLPNAEALVHRVVAGWAIEASWRLAARRYWAADFMLSS
jgi:hypothetical protein